MGICIHASSRGSGRDVTMRCCRSWSSCTGWLRSRAPVAGKYVVSEVGVTSRVRGRESEKEQTMATTVTFDVKGMTCDHCVHAVTEAAKSVEGVKDARVDLASNSAQV